MSSHLNSVADRLLSVFCRFVLKYFINRWDNLALWLIEGGGITKQVTIFHYESREKTEKIDRFISASIYKIHAKCRLVRGVFFFVTATTFSADIFSNIFCLLFPEKFITLFFAIYYWNICSEMTRILNAHIPHYTHLAQGYSGNTSNDLRINARLSEDVAKNTMENCKKKINFNSMA